MRKGPAHIAVLAVLALLAVANGNAATEPGRLVQITYEDRQLNGWITGTDDSPVTILMLHGTLAHANMEIMSTLADVFAEYGVETLRVSLSLGLDDRHGMFDCAAVHRHAHADAAGELDAWMSWLKENGRDSIVLLGHSRATNQVARYAALADSTQPLGLVLVAPGAWSHDAVAARFAEQGQGALAPLLRRAEAMIASGRGDDVIDPVPFLHCQDAAVSARSFAAYYRDDPLFDTFALIDDTDLPVIILSGTEDPLTKGLEDAIAGLRDTLAHVSIEGADHFFRDLYAYDVVEAVQAWLAETVSAADAVTVPQAADLSADAARASTAGLPMLLLVTREDCGFCALLKRAVIVPMILSGEYDTRVIIRELNLDAVTPLVDFDGGSVTPFAVAHRYDAVFTPTVLLVGPQGEELHERLLGINNDEMYLFYLDRAIGLAATRLDQGRD